MYSSDRIKDSVKKDIAILLAGIHENVSLVGARSDASPTSGNKFLEITFEKEGKPFKHTEWEPKQFGDESAESFQTKCDNQFRRILDILACFYDRNTLEFKGDSFKEFADWVAEKLNSADKSKLVRVKIVYNNSGYTTLPKYAKYTFIEPMTVSKEDSLITELSIDNFNRPVIADKEQTKVNPETMLTGTTSEANPNDLPF